MQDLIRIIGDLKKREVGFKSLTEGIDTTHPGGVLIFHIFGALAQFERELLLLLGRWGFLGIQSIEREIPRQIPNIFGKIK